MADDTLNIWSTNNLGAITPSLTIDITNELPGQSAGAISRSGDQLAVLANATIDDPGNIEEHGALMHMNLSDLSAVSIVTNTLPFRAGQFDLGDDVVALSKDTDIVLLEENATGNFETAATIETGERSLPELSVIGDRVILGTRDGSLRLWNIADASSPLELPGIAGSGLSHVIDIVDVGSQGMVAVVESHNIQTHSFDMGVLTKAYSRAESPGAFDRIAVDGDLAYVSSAEGGLHTVDISPMATPSILSFLSPSEIFSRTQPISQLEVSGGQAVLTQNDSVAVLDVSVPEAPRVNAVHDGFLGKGIRNTIGITDLQHHDDAIYALLDQEGQISLYDLTDPKLPLRLSRVATGLGSYQSLVKIDAGWVVTLGDDLSAPADEGTAPTSSIELYAVDDTGSFSLTTSTSTGAMFSKACGSDANVIVLHEKNPIARSVASHELGELEFAPRGSLSVTSRLSEFASFMECGDSLIALGDEVENVSLFSISSSGEIAFESSIEGAMGVTDAVISSGSLVLSSPDEIRVYNVTDPTRPTLRGVLESSR